MSFALLIIGLLLVTASVRNTQDTLVSLVARDFSGPGNFLYWVLAILVVGAVGYIPKAKPVSDGLLVLILVALILSRGNPKNPNGGFFSQFLQAFGTTTKQTAGVQAAPGQVTAFQGIWGGTVGVNIGDVNIGVGIGG